MGRYVVNDPKTTGVVYILTNPSFEEYVKIGYADDLEKRLDELNRTECTPFAFRAYAYLEVEKRLADKEFHHIFDTIDPERRSIDHINGKTREREFFNISAKEAYSIFKSVATIGGYENRLHFVDMTENEAEEEQIAEDNRSSKMRRPPLHFSWIGIKPGDKLVYKNDQTIVCEVVSDRRVKYNERIMSISNVAEELLNKPNLNGNLYFMFNGKLLCDLREEYDSKLKND